MKLLSYIQACRRAARTSKEPAIIRTTILEHHRATFDEYQQWYMVDKAQDDQQTGLWWDNINHESGDGDYMVSERIQCGFFSGPL